MDHTLTGLGLMSGSSLDGLDLALCRFQISASPLSVPEWEICYARTAPLPEALRNRLAALPEGSARRLAQAHADFGRWMGAVVSRFLAETDDQPEFIASHGHTIFHWPEKGVSTQIGDGAALAAATGLPVICDFRTLDVALGGQGAPVAPIADSLLFPQFTHFLNLGGIANISFRDQGRWIAFDLGPANQVFNHLASQLGRPYDPGGEIARSGALLPDLLAALEALPFFHQAPPKSLDNGWIREMVLPLIDAAPGSIPDKMHTAVVLLARQLAALEGFESGRLLATGGGAYNHFLMETIAEALPDMTIDVPPPGYVEFKEAALMALMGALRLLGLPNCMASVTGARRDSSGGAIYHG